MRNFYPEGVMQRENIMNILGLRLVSEVTEKLDLSGYAAYRLASDAARHKSFRWIPEGPSARLRLQAPPFRIKGDGVEVYVAELRMRENEADG